MALRFSTFSFLVVAITEKYFASLYIISSYLSAVDESSIEILNTLGNNFPFFFLFIFISLIFFFFLTFSDTSKQQAWIQIGVILFHRFNIV